MTNQIIQKNDFVITLFVIIDDLLKTINRFCLNSPDNKGRKAILTDAEIIVLILLRWKTTSVSWRSFYYEVCPYYYPLLRKSVKYQNFIANVNRVLPLCARIVQVLNFLAIGESKSLFCLDSTPVPVCHIKRALSNELLWAGFTD